MRSALRSEGTDDGVEESRPTGAATDSPQSGGVVN